MSALPVARIRPSQAADDGGRLVGAEVDPAPIADAVEQPAEGVVVDRARAGRSMTWRMPTMTLPRASRSAVASTSDGDTEAGIDANMAVSGFSTTTVPPACFTFQAPADPSDPVPVRTTAMTRSPWVLGCAREQEVDGRRDRSASGGPKPQPVLGDLDEAVRGDDEDDAVLEPCDPVDDRDRQDSVALQDLGQVARPPGVKVLGDDDRGWEIRRQVGDHARQRLDPARG